MHVETDDVSPIELGEYEYYGLHWRSVKRSDTSQTPDGLDEERLLYYNAAWQLIEERIDADYTGSPGTDSVAELFWGIRYIDDLMLRRVDESAAGTTFKRWYPLTDAQFSVRAVLRDDAGVHERINYSPYGVAEHHWGGDVDNDRSADFFDWLALGNQVALGSVGIGQANYVAEMDLNRDGVLDSNDSNAIGSGTALPSGWISAAGAGNPGNVIGFDGYVFNPEIETYSVRFRWYDPELGRWLQRDPAGYVEGMNLYQYVSSAPNVLIDPFGLDSDDCCDPEEDGEPKPREFLGIKQVPVGFKPTYDDDLEDWLEVIDVMETVLDLSTLIVPGAKGHAAWLKGPKAFEKWLIEFLAGKVAESVYKDVVEAITDRGVIHEFFDGRLEHGHNVYALIRHYECTDDGEIVEHESWVLVEGLGDSGNDNMVLPGDEDRAQSRLPRLIEKILESRRPIPPADDWPKVLDPK